MVLGKLPVPGRPTIWITVGQEPTALAVGAGGVCLAIFILIYPFSSLSPSFWETARYRLKYCLKGPLNPKQPTNQPSFPVSASVVCGPAICVVFVILSVFGRLVVICRPDEWPVFWFVLSVCVLLRSVLLVGVVFVLFFNVPGLPGMMWVLCSVLLCCVFLFLVCCCV